MSYVGSVNSKVAPTTTIYQAARAIDSHSIIEEEDLRAATVPERWVSPQAVRDPEMLIGRRVSFNVAEGTFVGSDMLLPASSLNENEREIALTVDAKTGLAGRIRSGDLVDVYAVFGEDGSGSSKVLVRDVRVVSVRGVETRSQQSSSNNLEEREVIPVTLALQPNDALAVTYADAFAASVRLVGLPPEITKTDRSEEPSKIDAGDLGLPQGRN